jgi:ankyrin repeat protein
LKFTIVILYYDEFLKKYAKERIMVMNKVKLMVFSLLTFSFLSGNPQPDSQQLIKIISDRTKSEDQKISELTTLLSQGADVNIKSSDIPNFTPLMRASDLGYLNIIKMLLDKGALPNALDSLNNSALFYAARKGHLDIVKLLVSRGAVVTLVNKQGNNILLDILRSYGANLGESKDKEKFKKNIQSIIELLVDKGANVNAQGSTAEGMKTPIIWAAGWKDYELIKLLIRKKANICVEDSFGHRVSYYLPDPSKDKTLTSTEINTIKWFKDVESQECKGKKISVPGKKEESLLDSIVGLFR